jgi:hypothetical protein
MKWNGDGNILLPRFVLSIPRILMVYNEFIRYETANESDTARYEDIMILVDAFTIIKLITYYSHHFSIGMMSIVAMKRSEE